MVAKALSIVSTFENQQTLAVGSLGHVNHLDSVWKKDDQNVYIFTRLSGVTVSRWDGNALTHITTGTEIFHKNYGVLCVHVWEDENGVFVAVGGEDYMIVDDGDTLALLEFVNETELQFRDSTLSDLVRCEALDSYEDANGDRIIVAGSGNVTSWPSEKYATTLRWNGTSLSFIASSPYADTSALRSVATWVSEGTRYIGVGHRRSEPTYPADQFELFEYSNHTFTKLAGDPVYEIHIESAGSFGRDGKDGNTFFLVCNNLDDVIEVYKWDGNMLTLEAGYLGRINLFAGNKAFIDSEDRWFIVVPSGAAHVILLEWDGSGLIEHDHLVVSGARTDLPATVSSLWMDGEGTMFFVLQCRMDTEEITYNTYIVRIGISVLTPILSTIQENSNIQVTWTYPEE